MREREVRTEMPSPATFRAILADLRLSLRSRQLLWAIKYNFNPAQPRVPRGVPEGGRWTDGGFGSDPSSQKPDRTASGRSEDGGRIGRRIPFEDSELVRIARRLQADDRVGKPVRLAQWWRGPRGTGPRSIGGGNRVVEPTPTEEMAFAAALRAYNKAYVRVHGVDSNWKPTPSATETVRGEIAHYLAAARQADARFFELQRNGIGPGPFAAESIPARGPGRNFTFGERQEINRIGRETGCHTCGAKESGLPSGTFFKDHQLPTRWGRGGGSQRIYPQCQTCNGRQGGYVRFHTER